MAYARRWSWRDRHGAGRLLGKCGDWNEDEAKRDDIDDLDITITDLDLTIDHSTL
jgi:hypothetical protein